MKLGCSVLMVVTLLMSAPMVWATQVEGKLRLGHYSSADGTVGAIIDRTGSAPLLRIDGEPEIWALTPETSGTNTNLKRDDGYIVIVIGAWAQHELWRDGQRDGVMIVRDADAEPLVTPAVTQAALDERISRAIAEAQTAVGSKLALRVGAKSKTDKDRGLLASVIDNIVVALKKVGNDDLGKSAIKTGLKEVIVTDGKSPKAKVEKGVLSIEVSPSEGFAGRPSSAVLKKVLESSL